MDKKVRKKVCVIRIYTYLCAVLKGNPLKADMVRVAQLVRASDCGSEGRGFEPIFHHCGFLDKNLVMNKTKFYEPRRL